MIIPDYFYLHECYGAKSAALAPSKFDLDSNPSGIDSAGITIWNSYFITIFNSVDADAKGL